jgi:ribosomal protein S18 acetylase RimI-like enzyme
MAAAVDIGAVETPDLTGSTINENHRLRYMKFTYRLITTHDQDFLWEMLYQAIYVPDGSPPPPRDTIFRPDLARYVQGWGQPDDVGILAMAEQKRAGAAWTRLLSGDNRGYGYVDDSIPELSIAILPEYRGMGIGAALLERLLAAARDRYPGVSLSVTPTNPARRLYERAGFVPGPSPGDSLTMLLKFVKGDEA